MHSPRSKGTEHDYHGNREPVEPSTLRAAFLLLLDPRGHILAIPRTKDGLTGWALPGGKQEHGETDEETAVRECEEETGLLASAKSMLHQAIMNGRTCTTFFGILHGGELRPSPEGTPEWVTPDRFCRDNDFIGLTAHALENAGIRVDMNDVSAYGARP